MATTRKSHKWQKAVLAVLLAIALVVGTWLLASYFQSPAQRAAKALPPPPEPVVVEVARRDLVERTSTAATAELEGAGEIAIPLGQIPAVVTAAGASANADLNPGEVATWVNGMPVFALRGDFPLYRELTVGSSGPDVKMIQLALTELGYEVLADGEFGQTTQACILDLYKTVGAEPFWKEAASAAPNTAAGPQSGADVEQEGAADQRQGERALVLRPSDLLIQKSFPLRVLSVPPVGASLTEANAKIGVAGTEVTLKATVPGAVAERLNEGSSGTATLGDASVAVKIASIETKVDEAPAETAPVMNDSSAYVVTFISAESSLPSEWTGSKQVLVTIDLSQPLLDVLVVPQRAIAAGADGRTNVLVRGPDAEFEIVEVTELGCSLGTCAVEGKGIDVGTRVRVDR